MVPHAYKVVSRTMHAYVSIWVSCIWVCEPMWIFVIGDWWLWCVLDELLNGEYVWMRCIQLGDFFDNDNFVYTLEVMIWIYLYLFQITRWEYMRILCVYDEKGD
jgi:hypothetical protein